ncbi:GAF domain-containing protein [Sphingomonas lutea]|uniref:GAF domain-containing protein n=1 Tax=Sphingomonas lutea TaxID=1045317 RepID=A0A7G9SGN0_9SPHN|nr:GAF domain-containing protein [Sphingomonas lutea]QNN67005.1 GAF domain-containing protein [Sphingomonas lutea]
MSKPKIQSAGFLLELSHDWLILGASENAHAFLGEYHQRLIGEPLSNFTLAQPLHDLRNSLSRQRSSSGVARAYRIRLFDDPRWFDIAFQLRESTILLEGLPSSDAGFGEYLGSVGRLLERLPTDRRQSAMEGAARCMRALTGYDRVALTVGGDRVESSRGKLPSLSVEGDLPQIVADSATEAVAIFPNGGGEDAGHALLRAPTAAQAGALRDAGTHSLLRVPVIRGEQAIGEFLCDCRTPQPASFERHAAAELFAQMLGMLLPG